MNAIHRYFPTWWPILTCLAGVWYGAFLMAAGSISAPERIAIVAFWVLLLNGPKTLVDLT